MTLTVEMEAREREELESPRPGYYYLSFVDPDTGFLGGAVTEAIGPVSAVGKSWALGFNPGGEVQILGPIETIPEGSPIDTLLSFSDMEELGWDPQPHGGNDNGDTYR